LLLIEVELLRQQLQTLSVLGFGDQIKQGHHGSNSVLPLASTNDSGFAS
jgi:hypothetical protein